MKIDDSTGKTNPGPRTKKFWVVAKRSFAKSEIYASLNRVNRLHSYANTILLAEQHNRMERID